MDFLRQFACQRFRHDEWYTGTRGPPPRPGVDAVFKAL